MKKHPAESIREFNRFYTGVIGLLNQHLLDSPFSLSEARILYEIYHHQPCTATDIVTQLPIDKGLLSRTLDQFKKKGLLTRKKSNADGRASQITLTTKGNSEFETLNQSTDQQIRALLKGISGDQQVRLVQNMNEIMKILKSIQ